MKRRNFLFSAAITSTFAGVAEFRRAQGATLSSLITLDRVGISTWSFHTLFPATRESHEALPPGQTFNLLDYPAMIADRYQVHNLEMVAPHFESTRPSYLQELKQRLTRTHSRLVNMPSTYRSLSKAADCPILVTVSAIWRWPPARSGSMWPRR